jgi:hypothetical protein
MEHPNCPFFISSADVAGALRLQHQRTLPMVAGGGGGGGEHHHKGKRNKTPP